MMTLRLVLPESFSSHLGAATAQIKPTQEAMNSATKNSYDMADAILSNQDCCLAGSV